VSKGARTLRADAFCDRDFYINPMIFKLEGDLDTAEEVPQRPTLRCQDTQNWEPNWKNTKISLKVTGQGPMQKAPTHFSVIKTH